MYVTTRALVLRAADYKESSRMLTLLTESDGKISAADARLALRFSVNLEKLDDKQKAAADVDHNGSVTAADARIILRASVGLEKIT